MSDEDVKYYAELACAHTFIEQLEHGYDTRIGERGIHLSGGQRQRIALARAFASDPKILILDNSTSGLDSGTEKEVMNGIQNVRKGRTTLLITNRLPLIRRADLIILLSRGTAIAQGSHNGLLRNSAAYRDLFAQKEVT
ncbi:Alpha-hemolysin translocation ATP-binding protein HlyB [compost metagenome]